MTEKKRNKSNGERTYLMTGRVPLVDLASWQEEIVRESSDSPPTGGRGGGRKINMSGGMRLDNLS
jgi:hypothetical protein